MCDEPSADSHAQPSKPWEGVNVFWGGLIETPREPHSNGAIPETSANPRDDAASSHVVSNTFGTSSSAIAPSSAALGSAERTDEAAEGCRSATSAAAIKSRDQANATDQAAVARGDDCAELASQAQRISQSHDVAALELDVVHANGAQVWPAADCV